MVREDINFKEVPARLASIILELVENEGVVTDEGYKIPTHYTHDQLATMIGADRASATRAFAKLSEAGIVEQREGRIFVKDLEALGSAAGEEQRAKRLAECD